MPNDRIQIIKPNLTAYDADVGMKRNHNMAAVLPTGQTNITHHADQSSAWDKDSVDLFPNLCQFIQENFIICDVSKLGFIIILSLECPIRGRSHNKMHRLILDIWHFSGISLNKPMGCNDLSSRYHGL